MMPSLTSSSTTSIKEDDKPRSEKDKKREMLPFLALPNDPKVIHMLDDELNPPIKFKEEIIEKSKIKEKVRENEWNNDKKKKSEKEPEKDRQKSEHFPKKEPESEMDNLMAFLESHAPSKQKENCSSQAKDKKRRLSRSHSRERKRSKSPRKHKSKMEQSHSHGKDKRRSHSRERRNRSNSRERSDSHEKRHGREKYGNRKDRHRRKRSRSPSKDDRISRSQERYSSRSSHSGSNRDMFVNRPPDENPVVGKVSILLKMQTPIKVIVLRILILLLIYNYALLQKYFYWLPAAYKWQPKGKEQGFWKFPLYSLLRKCKSGCSGKEVCI